MLKSPECSSGQPTKLDAKDLNQELVATMPMPLSKCMLKRPTCSSGQPTKLDARHLNHNEKQIKRSPSNQCNTGCDESAELCIKT